MFKKSFLFLFGFMCYANSSSLNVDKVTTDDSIVHENNGLSKFKLDICCICNQDIEIDHHKLIDGKNIPYKGDAFYIVPKCNHKFHLTCIKKILKKQDLCPVKNCACKIESSALFKYLGISPRVMLSVLRHHSMDILVWSGFILFMILIDGKGRALDRLNYSNGLLEEKNKLLEKFKLKFKDAEKDAENTYLQLQNTHLQLQNALSESIILQLEPIAWQFNMLQNQIVSNSEIEDEFNDSGTEE